MIQRSLKKIQEEGIYTPSSSPALNAKDQKRKEQEIRHKGLVAASDNNQQIMTQKKTIILIAHRLSNIEKADEIFVMKGGKIVQRGKHEEMLMDKDGVYSELYSNYAVTKDEDQSDEEE